MLAMSLFAFVSWSLHFEVKEPSCVYRGWSFIFSQKIAFTAIKNYVLVLNHLVLFQCILQFTVIFIFAVSGALGRRLEMTVKIMWSCYLGYLPENTFYKSKQTSIFHEKHTLKYILFWTSKNWFCIALTHVVRSLIFLAHYNLLRHNIF